MASGSSDPAAACGSEMSKVKTKGSKEVVTIGEVGGVVRTGNTGVRGIFVGAEVGASVLIVEVIVGIPVGIVVGVSVGAEVTAVEGAGVTGAGVSGVDVSVYGVVVGLGVIARVGHIVGFAVGATVGQLLGFVVGGGSGGSVGAGGQPPQSAELGAEVTSSSCGGKDGNTTDCWVAWSSRRLSENALTSSDAQGFISSAVPDISSVTIVRTDGHCGGRRFILHLPTLNADVTETRFALATDRSSPLEIPKKRASDIRQSFNSFSLFIAAVVSQWSFSSTHDGAMRASASDKVQNAGCLERKKHTNGYAIATAIHMLF